MKHLKKTILHIEDDPEYRTLVSQLLRKSFHYLGADSAEKAVLLLPKKNVDLIVLDLALPRMNGFEFLDNHRPLLSEKKIPVILTTGVAGKNIEEISQTFRLLAFFTKPFSPLALLEEISRYFSCMLQA